MSEPRIKLREAWYPPDTDGLPAEMFVEDNGDEWLLHVETADGFLTVSLAEFYEGINALVTTEVLR